MSRVRNSVGVAAGIAAPPTTAAWSKSYGDNGNIARDMGTGFDGNACDRKRQNLTESYKSKTTKRLHGESADRCRHFMLSFKICLGIPM